MSSAVATDFELSQINQRGSAPSVAAGISPPHISIQRGANEMSEREDFQECDLERERFLNVAPEMIA